MGIIGLAADHGLHRVVIWLVGWLFGCVGGKVGGHLTGWVPVRLVGWFLACIHAFLLAVFLFTGLLAWCVTSLLAGWLAC